jgi:hypothetical protein
MPVFSAAAGRLLDISRLLADPSDGVAVAQACNLALNSARLPWERLHPNQRDVLARALARQGHTILAATIASPTETERP